jgi:drug/metabolite transporter (DMT)-like permease
VTAASRAWLQIHFCVVLWGFTAILGKMITVRALPLVWWRMLLVTASLLVLPGFWLGLRRLSPRMIATYGGIGVLVAMHWLAFYGSIKLSNASVAAMCMALAPVFVSFVEPALAGRRFDFREVFFGIAVIPGVAFVVGGTPVEMRAGIAAGVLSAFLAAVFGTLNKRFVEGGEALAVTGLEMGAGAICLALLGVLSGRPDAVFVRPDGRDAALLVVLAIGCTLVPFALSLVALRHLTAFATALAINMEPVYAIVLAIPILGEQRELHATFYAGVAIILLVVFGHGLLTRRQKVAVQSQ